MRDIHWLYFYCVVVDQWKFVRDGTREEEREKCGLIFPFWFHLVFEVNHHVFVF